MFFSNGLWIYYLSIRIWHICLLNYELNHLEHNIIPWDLCIQIFPNLKKVHGSLKLLWESNLQTCSSRMISILCSQYEHEISLFDEQI